MSINKKKYKDLAQLMEDDFQRDNELEQQELNKDLRKKLKGKTIKEVFGWYSMAQMGISSIELTFTDDSGVEFTKEGIKWINMD